MYLGWICWAGPGGSSAGLTEQTKLKKTSQSDFIIICNINIDALPIFQDKDGQISKADFLSHAKVRKKPHSSN